MLHCKRTGTKETYLGGIQRCIIIYIESTSTHEVRLGKGSGMHKVVPLLYVWIPLEALHVAVAMLMIQTKRFEDVVLQSFLS